MQPQEDRGCTRVKPSGTHRKADSTLRASRAVPHPSTDRALCRLTSEVRRDPVHSTRYGRQRKRTEHHCETRRLQEQKECMRQDIRSTVAEHMSIHATHGKRRSCTPQSLDNGAAVSFELSISSLHSGVRFGLLCCQPEPVPRSLPARIPQLTPQYPCGPLV